MNECSQNENVSVYHDGEMPPQAQSDFESHLSVCPQCKAELARLQQVSSLLQSIEQPAGDSQLMARLHAGVDTLPQIGAVRRLAQALAAVAAGIVVVCAVTLSQGGPAQAEAAAAWESDALNPPAAETAQVTSEDAVAGWVVQDLAGKD